MNSTNTVIHTTSPKDIALEKEEGFSAKKHFAIGLIITSIAVAILPVCFPASIALFVASAWCFYSSAIIIANRYASDDTRLGKLIHRLHAIAMEMTATAINITVFPRTFSKSFHNPKITPPQATTDGSPPAAANQTPILMLNGYMSFGAIWHYQKQAISNAGLGPIYSINVGTGKSIEHYAKQVKNKVLEIQEKTGSNDLTLIGHSKGGLVASYYTVHLASRIKSNVKNLITIGTPLKGTPMARLGIGTDAKQMRPNSEFAKDLRKKLRENWDKTRVYHIASKTDQVVPYESAFLSRIQKSRFLKLNNLGHRGLVFSTRVSKQIISWLKNPDKTESSIKQAKPQLIDETIALDLADQPSS